MIDSQNVSDKMVICMQELVEHCWKYPRISVICPVQMKNMKKEKHTCLSTKYSQKPVDWQFNQIHVQKQYFHNNSTKTCEYTTPAYITQYTVQRPTTLHYLIIIIPPINSAMFVSDSNVQFLVKSLFIILVQRDFELSGFRIRNRGNREIVEKRGKTKQIHDSRSASGKEKVVCLIDYQ